MWSIAFISSYFRADVADSQERDLGVKRNVTVANNFTHGFWETVVKNSFPGPWPAPVAGHRGHCPERIHIFAILAGFIQIADNLGRSGVPTELNLLFIIQTDPGRKNDGIANRARADVDATLRSRDCVLISSHKGIKNIVITITRNPQHRHPASVTPSPSITLHASRSASRLRSSLTLASERLVCIHCSDS